MTPPKLAMAEIDELELKLQRAKKKASKLRAEIKQLRADNHAMVALLRWASRPGCTVFSTDSDNWYAHEDLALRKVSCCESAYALADLLGLLPSPAPESESNGG